MARLLAFFSLFLRLGLAGFDLLPLFGGEDSKYLLANRFAAGTHLVTKRLGPGLLVFGNGSVSTCFTDGFQLFHSRRVRFICFVDLLDLGLLGFGQFNTHKTSHPAKTVSSSPMAKSFAFVLFGPCLLRNGRCVLCRNSDRERADRYRRSEHRNQFSL